MGEWAGGPIHYIRYEPDILDIFSKYSLNIPRIYSNISLSGGREGILGITGGRVVRGHPNNPDKNHIDFFTTPSNVN
jgi:hypothetical protein